MATPVITATATATHAASPTQTPSTAWITADPPSAITDAYNVHTDVSGNSLYVAYQSGSGTGKMINIKYYTPYNGWNDEAINLATTYSGGGPWFVKGLMSAYAAACDASGYVYVYYRNYAGTGWEPLGTNPVAGPGCAEASVAYNFMVSAPLENVYVAYVDTANGNRIKAKRIDILSDYSATSWQDVSIFPGTAAVNRVNNTGNLWIDGYEAFISNSYYLAFADASSNTLVSTRYITGTETNFVAYNAGSIASTGAPAYITTDRFNFGTLTAFSDSGRGGRAIVTFGTSEISGPASSGAAKYLSIAYGSDYLLGYADAAASDVIRLKEYSSGSWTDLGLPAETIESCSVGYMGVGVRYVAYTAGPADGRKLKLRILQQ